MGLLEHIHPWIEEADYTKMSVKLTFVLASFLGFVLIFMVSAVGSNLMKTYRKLRNKEKMFWNLAVVRGVYGFICIVFGVWAIFVDTELVKDVVFATTPTSYFAMTVTVGFFLFECAMLSFSDYYYKQFNILLNIHHWISLVGFSAVIYLDSTHFFGMRGLILEMSTPFSCLCWTLLKADMANSLLWRANQFLLVHTFHLRSVVECYIWVLTYAHWERIWAAMPVAMFTLFYTQLVLVTFLMTPYWAYKKTQQLITPVDWNFEDDKSKSQTNGQTKRDTPFSGLCWTLLKADMAHSLLWRANQFLLVNTFHLRSVVECYIWVLTYAHWERIWATMPMAMFTLLYTQLVLVTFLMTPHWAYKKTQQLITPVDWNFEDDKNKSQTNGQTKRE